MTAAAATAPVSVVIPFYDGAATLQRALDSIAGQTLRPAEVVVVDDGSPEPFERCDFDCDLPLRAVRHDRNRGIPAARNTGIRAAAQPWIGFLDQDDEWAPGKLERQWRVVERDKPSTRPNEADGQGDAPAGSRELVVFGRLLMESEHRRTHLRPPRRSISAIEEGDRAAFRAFLRYGNVLPFVTLLAPRAVFERHGYLDESLTGGADDTELVLRLLGEGVPFRYGGPAGSDEWDVAHRLTGRNYSGEAPRWVGDQLEFIPRLARRYPSFAPLRDRFLARSHFTLGRHHEREGDRTQAAAEYRRATGLDPGWWKPWVARVNLFTPSPITRGIERLLRVVR